MKEPAAYGAAFAALEDVCRFLRLVTGEPPRDALGARVEVLRAGRRPVLRRMGTDGSYASSGDPRLTVPLGDGPIPDLRVTWPDGAVQTVVAAGRYTTLRRER